MDVLLMPLYNLFDTLLWLYFWIVLVSVIMSWLLAFGIVNTSNQFVASLNEFLFRVTDPVLKPIRAKLPDLGGLDVSPFIVLLAIHFIRDFLHRLVASIMGTA